MNRAFIRLVALVARRDYLRTVRRRGFIAGTLLLPLSMGAIFAFSAFFSMGGTAPRPTGPLLVVNESSMAITADPALTPRATLVDRAAAEAALAEGRATAYYVVPADWPEQRDIRRVVADGGSTSRPLDAISLERFDNTEMELLLRLAILRNAGLPDSALGQLLAPVDFTSVSPSGEPINEASAVAGYALPYIFTLIFVMSIFITSGYLLQSVTEEKENRVVEIVLSSVPALPLMAGKVLGLGAAGLTQVAIWMLTALVAIPLVNQQFAIDVTLAPHQLVLAILFFCLGYLGYGAIFAAVGAVAPGAREGQQYSGFFGFFAVVPVIATPVFVSDPGSPIVLALALFPLTAPAAALELLSLPSTPWMLVGASLASQLVFVALATVFASRIFRATLLLYGVRPSIRRVLGAMLTRG